MTSQKPAASVRNKPAIGLLAVDDEVEFLELVTDALAQEGLEILTTTDAQEGLQIVVRKHPQIVLLDLRMPKMGGMEALEQILEINPTTDVIMITSDYSTESAVEAIQKGASDYLNKPVSIEALRQKVGKLVAEVRLRQRASQLVGELVDTIQFEGMVSQSPLMQEVFERIRRIAPHFRTVLVTGATGTGKELVARALHRLSPAADGPFAVCNCSALAETLLESELFGYVKGAFTGALQDKVGLFEYAHGGTVFLDEIGEMPLIMQAKLLRVLQNQEIQRVGSPAIRKVDVRVIAATHRDLSQMLAEKQFREDLYYRLSMVQVKLPRLAERKEDLPLLERYFLEHFAREYRKPISGLTRRAQVCLSRHAWPGNIRELENAVGHACMMAEGNEIDLSDLPESLHPQAVHTVSDDDDLTSLDEVQRRHVCHVLERVNGNKGKAAEVLGISRTTLYRLLAESEGQTDNRHKE